MADEKKAKAGSSIRTCGCKHAFQDSEYGVGNRVKNNTSKGDYRCTVCGTVSK